MLLSEISSRVLVKFREKRQHPRNSLVSKQDNTRAERYPKVDQPAEAGDEEGPQTEISFFERKAENFAETKFSIQNETRPKKMQTGHRNVNLIAAPSTSTYQSSAIPVVNEVPDWDN